MASAEVEIRIVPTLPVWVVCHADDALESIWFTRGMAEEARDVLNAQGGQFKVRESRVQVR